MPLKTGPGSVRYNVSELTTGKIGTSRKKAIKTLAKKRGISQKKARFIQALAIARKQVTS